MSAIYASDSKKDTAFYPSMDQETKLHGRGKSLAVGPLSSLVRVKRVRVNVVVSRLLGSNCNTKDKG